MKKSFILVFLALPVFCFSQTPTLEISTPQPRLGDNFSLTINIDTVAKNTFSFLSGKFNISSNTSSTNTGSMLSANMQATKLGHNEIGPLTLNVNGTKYTTNKITFDVVDSLPAKNEGLWIRQVPIDDTSVYLIIEQRIPALTYVTHGENSINMTTKANDDNKEIEMVKDSAGVYFHGSTEDYRSVANAKTGVRMDFKNFFAMYRITKTDKSKPMIITKSYFNNIPDYYLFQDIIIK
jgi:hypothetical protein